MQTHRLAAMFAALTVFVSFSQAQKSPENPRLAPAATAAATATTAASATDTGEIVNLETFEVTGYREGRARALREKRRAPSLREVISADSIGNLPDRNVAEAASRVAGVAISLEQGEGQFVSIRGVEPNLNQVSIEGAIVAAPGAGGRTGRSVPLDVISASAISQIEVIKVLTPDLDANGLGGFINLKTASAFDHRDRFTKAVFSTNYNETRERPGYGADIAWSDRLGGGKWGLALNANYEFRPYRNDWLQIGAWRTGDAGQWLPGSFERKPETGDRRTIGLTGNLEYRPSATAHFFFRPILTQTRRNETTEEIIDSINSVTGANIALATLTSGTFKASGVGRTERREFHSRRDQTLLNNTAGAVLVFGHLTAEPSFTWSYAQEDRPFNDSLQFRTSNGAVGDIAFDHSGFTPALWQTSPAHADPSKYPLRRALRESSEIEEKTYAPKIDFTYDASALFGGRPAVIKAGGKFTRRDRFVDDQSYRLIPVGNWTLADVGVLPGKSIYDGRHHSGFSLNYDATWAFLNDPARAQYDEGESYRNANEDDYEITEKILSAYALARVDLGPVRLLGGVRYEGTDGAIAGNEFRTEDGAFLGIFRRRGTFNYDNVLPNLQLAWTPLRRLTLRAAFTTSLGRPAYEDAAPKSNFSYDPDGTLDPAYPHIGSLTIGNPSLVPYESDNYDLALEWAHGRDGFIALGLFRKNIANPIYTYRSTAHNIVHDGIALEQLSIESVRNAGKGHIDGVELAVYEPFSFLPAPFNRFGLDANITFIRSEVTVATRAGEDFPFFRQPDLLYNLTLFYETPRFSARVAWRYEDDQLDSLGAGRINDIWRKARGQLDAQLRWRFAPAWALTLALRNLTSEPEEFSYGYKNLMRTSRLLQRDLRLALEWQL